MEKPVILSIQGAQSSPESGEDTVELITEGRLEDRGTRGLCITYAESALTGMEGTQTILEVERGDRVTLRRTGQFNSQMVFQPGERYLSAYQTPYGDLSMSVITERMRNTLKADGGELKIEYALEVGDRMVGRNQICIRVREDDRPGRGSGLCQ